VRKAAVISWIVVVLSSCGRPSVEDVLSDTAANLGKIQSGKLSMRMLTAVEGDPQTNVGFELRGPFSVDEGSLLANITYMKVAGPERASARFISTGEKAFIDTGSEINKLPPLAFAGDLGVAGGGLAQLPIGHWFENPILSDGGTVGGAETYHVNARLNVGAALADIFTLARQLGASAVAGLPPLNAADLEHLERIVRSAHIDIYTGKDDRLLRRMEMQITFGATGPSELQAILENLAGVRFTFDLSIDDPNVPIEVQAP
jgi:hypothetical protein